MSRPEDMKLKKKIPNDIPRKKQTQSPTTAFRTNFPLFK